MCDPISGAFMAFSAVGAYSSSAGEKAAYNAKAQIARNNAQIAEWQAQDAIDRGAIAASRQGIKTNQLKGSQRAALAANGVDLGVGSALEILTDTDFFGALDRNAIVDNAAREAWGYRNQATNYRNDAAVFKLRADSEHPLMAAGTSLLTNAKRVAPDWYRDVGDRLQAGFSNTRLGSSGFGSGFAYGNQDLGENF